MTPGQTPLPFRTIEQAETSEQSAVESELVAMCERLQVRWVLRRLADTGGLVDRLEGQLAETGAELADVKHQLQRLQLSACRLVAVNGGRA